MDARRISPSRCNGSCRRPRPTSVATATPRTGQFTIAHGDAFELTRGEHACAPAVGTGYGLVGMRERVEPLGGTFLAAPTRRTRGGRWSNAAEPAHSLSADPTDRPVTVLLADDQAMVRAGFQMIIDSQPDMTVIGEADNGRSAVDLARRLRPDVCAARHPVPVLDGLAATRLLAGPDVQDPLAVVITTTFDTDEHVEYALRNGAAGFILKDGGPHCCSKQSTRPQSATP